MRKVILDKKDITTIRLTEIGAAVPIFAKKHGILVGMVIRDNGGWVCRTGGSLHMTGVHITRSECIESCENLGYEFFVN